VLATGLGNTPAVRVWISKHIGSVPELSKNPTCRLLAGQTRTRTNQPAGVDGFT
jgi:hypothetical protein